MVYYTLSYGHPSIAMSSVGGDVMLHDTLMSVYLNKRCCFTDVNPAKEKMSVRGGCCGIVYVVQKLHFASRKRTFSCMLPDKQQCTVVK